MRLSAEHRALLKQEFIRQLGADHELKLFGSRLNDEARGGDVDLLVISPKPIEKRVGVACNLAARAERLLGGRRVDVLLIDPNTALLPIHHIAIKAGQPL